MTDPKSDNKPSRSLSEISHLFLSTLRENTGGEGRARPVRIPPGERAASPRGDDGTADSADEPTQRKRVTGIVTAQLDDQVTEATLAYAASLASRGERVGVMTVDATEFKLQIVECDSDVPASEPEVSDLSDARLMTETVRELNHDVDRWLFVVGDRRRPEARAIFSRVDDWTMLTTCDHDGIVAGYRTLKGLAEGAKSPLAIALMDAQGHEQSARAFDKLASVCRQFLDWDVSHERLETDVENARAYTVLWCHGPRDAAPADAPQWGVVEGFLELPPDAAANAAHYGTSAETALGGAATQINDVDDEFDAEALAMIDATDERSSVDIPSLARPIGRPAPIKQSSDQGSEDETMSMPSPAMLNGELSAGPLKRPGPTTNDVSDSFAFNNVASSVDPSGEVIELPDGVSVLSAFLRGNNALLTTPIAPPMCPGATVAVGRDRGLVLVAQAGTNLAGMDAIAAAVRWLDDSKQLIAMAMPQLTIDAARPTIVQLLIDHADRSAEGLRPLLGNSRITIRSYRRLRWAGRNGLLLDAA
jgi:hypothetical protein